VIKIKRTDSANNDFLELVQKLDAFLAEIDGDDHQFYAQFNKTGKLKYVIMVYENSLPVGCGAMREIESRQMEIKRMYTLPAYRGKGIASTVLQELEKWATELSYTKCVLETGNRQPEAISLYKKSGYRIIPNYGQYAQVGNSVCFEKSLTV